jgi:ATP-dependent RNA helicase DeaD
MAWNMETVETESTERTFAALNLSAETLSALEAKGYRAPTECQQEAIPRALAGKDLVVQSRTGTGKTAAFGIPISERIEMARGEPQALILAPTRELALQVSKEMSELGRGRGVRVETIYGGDPIERQIQGIERGAQVIVGTPGRVLDHLRRKTLRMGALKVLVLDEADRMLDMGFAVEMGEIMEYLPAERQTLLFSATVPLGIRGLIYHYLNEPEWVLLSEDQVYVKEVEHLYCLTPRFHKEATVYKLIEYENPASSMIFCNTREETRQVYAFLAGKGLPTAMLSSDLVQKKREKVLARFRSGEIRHLVTTDVASRGIDIEELSHVFIFSTPASPEQYIHRAGRTGRVGRSGRAISLISAHDLVGFNRLVKRYHVEVRELEVPSDDEVQARKEERIVTRLAAEGQALPLEDFVELSPIARRIGSHEQRDRVVALLLRRYFAAELPDEDEDDTAEAAAPPRRDGGGPRRDGRRPRRRY